MLFLGEVGDAYFVVESGCFDIQVKEPSGKTKLVAEVGAGAAFGEGALLFSTPRQATLKAQMTSVVWALDADKFSEIRNMLSLYEANKLTRIKNFLSNVDLLSMLQLLCLESEFENAIYF